MVHLSIKWSRFINGNLLYVYHECDYWNCKIKEVQAIGWQYKIKRRDPFNGNMKRKKCILFFGDIKRKKCVLSVRLKKSIIFVKIWIEWLFIIINNGNKCNFSLEFFMSNIEQVLTEGGIIMLVWK